MWHLVRVKAVPAPTSPVMSESVHVTAPPARTAKLDAALVCTLASMSPIATGGDEEPHAAKRSAATGKNTETRLVIEIFISLVLLGLFREEQLRLGDSRGHVGSRSLLPGSARCVPWPQPMSSPVMPPRSDQRPCAELSFGRRDRARSCTRCARRSVSMHARARRCGKALRCGPHEPESRDAREQGLLAEPELFRERGHVPARALETAEDLVALPGAEHAATEPAEGETSVRRGNAE